MLGVGSNALTIWQIILLGLPSPIWTAIAFALFSAGMITLVLEFRKEIQIKKGDRNEELAKTIPSISNTQITASSESHKQSSKVESKAKVTSLGERIIVNVTPDYLSNIFKEHVDIQAINLIKTFIGKWMKVNGTIFNIGAPFRLANGSEICSVSFESKSLTQTSVIMYFNKEWIDRLSVLKLGDKLTVLGQIEKVDRYTLTLENCEFINSLDEE